MLETGDRVQKFELDRNRQGSREAIHIQLGRVEALGLEKNLMPRRGRELHDLVLDGRAITRASSADRAAVECRLLEVLLDDFLHCCAGPGNPAWNLTGPLEALVE